MRIAFITFTIFPFGSADLLFYRAAENLLRQGHRVLISPLDWGGENAREYDLIAKLGATLCRRDRCDRSPFFLARQWQKVRHKAIDARKTWRFIEHFVPDVIVINDPGTFHMISAAGFVEYLMDSQFPFVTISNFNSENTYLSEPTYQRSRQIFEKARYCVFVSQRNLDVARRQLCLELKHAVITGNPPNLPSYEILPFPSDQPNSMAMVARLDCAIKGQALVLEILSQARWKERSWRLNFYGSGPDQTYLSDLIAFLGLRERAKLCGQVNDVRRIWKDNQILLMGSSGEGRPLALAEAMVCGRPAVVTDVGGNAELIKEGVTGFLAESPTLASLGMALDRAWQQREHWNSMGRCAHEFIIDRLNPAPEQLLVRLLTEINEPGTQAHLEPTAIRDSCIKPSSAV